jgi:hypothetical protein
MDAKFLIFMISCGISVPVWGRFDPADSERIDPEENNNTETWNDKNSYRYPLAWERDWSTAEMGYRINAGSLNVSRFNFEDDVKFTPRPLERFTASFIQTRHEDLLDRTIEREVRLGCGFANNMRVSLLGDVNTLKEFGDLGIAWGVHESPVSLTEVYVWSVDHYYLSKRSDEASTRDKESRTYGLRSRRRLLGQGVGWSGRFEWDTPIDWSLPTAGWRFQYDKRMFEGRLDFSPASQTVFYGSLSWERKFERKSVLVADEMRAFSKAMIRNWAVGEIGLEYRTSDSDQYVAALQRVWRHINYEYSLNYEPDSIPGETFGPSKVLRNEWGLIVTKHAPITSAISLQHGAMINDVFVREDLRVWKTTEVKYQLLFDFSLNDRSRFALNTTWDVDQIVRDFPYSKKSPFRPWGGGDLQFMMQI